MQAARIHTFLEKVHRDCLAARRDARRKARQEAQRAAAAAAATAAAAAGTSPSSSSESAQDVAMMSSSGDAAAMAVAAVPSSSSSISGSGGSISVGGSSADTAAAATSGGTAALGPDADPGVGGVQVQMEVEVVMEVVTSVVAASSPELQLSDSASPPPLPPLHAQETAPVSSAQQLQADGNVKVVCADGATQQPEPAPGGLAQRQDDGEEHDEEGDEEGDIEDVHLSLEWLRDAPKEKATE